MNLKYQEEAMKKILIADDEKNIRTIMKQCLKAEYETETAVNGEEVIEMLEKQRYDLVFLDINMPKLDGMQVLELINKKHINIIVVIMTAYGTIERAVEAMKMGAVDFINKPFTAEEIKLTVKRAFEREALNETNINTYEDYLEFSKKFILEGNYEKSEEYLRKAIAQNMSMPEPHNLLGAIYELKGDILQAKKHYRAALDLDPTYIPAKENLHRSSSLFEFHDSKIELGEFKKTNGKK